MFSCAEGREGRCRQISLACVGSTHSAPATLGLTPLTGVCFPRLHCSGSRLPYRGGPYVACGSSFRVLHKNVDSVGPAFCAFPAPVAQAARSLMSSLSPGAVRLIPSVVPASVSVSACWVRLVSVLGSWSPGATLPADVNHPESQEVFD